MPTVESGGTYTLVIEFASADEIQVGALGTRSFSPGYYAYVGTALGPGGFSRVDRHREIASGERDTRHWHIDYLLGHPHATIDTVRTTHDVDAECTLAARLVGEGIPGFGCSDCSCESHLFYSAQRAPLLDSITSLHDSLE